VARIVLGITGGIAAYKACEIIRLLVQAGHDVLPLPTRGRSGSSPPRRSTHSPGRLRRPTRTRICSAPTCSSSHR
jgi:hypothetical protein